MLIPTGLALPYRASRVIPATIVGRAKGRSMRALTTRLPGNSSRTSTQAMTVPITTLPAATTRATAKVRRSAARAWGRVAASQKAPQPSLPERHTTAVSGRTTIRLRDRVTAPRTSAATPPVPGPPRAGGGRGGGWGGGGGGRGRAAPGLRPLSRARRGGG